MVEALLVGVAAIVVLGVGAQWIAWRLHVPSILLLLGVGFLVGPILGLLDPDAMFGELLTPFVEVAVALILYEGGLSLRFSELEEHGGTIFRLVTVGVLVTLVATTVAAELFFGFDPGLAILLGAILVVTGPTVIIPMLRHMQPVERLGSILRWEGIMIDPIGAMLAVLVFEALLVGRLEAATTLALFGVLETLVFGGIIGAVFAGVLILLLRWHWVPDFLHNPVSLMLVVIALVASNELQPESGLLAVTVMGILLANQDQVPVKHIVEFKENLQVLLVGALFIVLAARLQPEAVGIIGLGALAFLAVLVLLARPLSVWISTLGSDLEPRERAMIGLTAPRGIVAAAIASLFALRLTEAGYPQAEALVPITFFTIIGTVAIYGIASPLLARRLGLADPDPQGVLIVGAHDWARALAHRLKEEGFRVMLADANRLHVVQAWDEGLHAQHGDVVSEEMMENLDFYGIGRMLALTSNDEVNALAALHFKEVFERSQVFQLVHGTEEDRQRLPPHLRGRFLFGPDVTYERLAALYEDGAEIRSVELEEPLARDDLADHFGTEVVPLFLITPSGGLDVVSRSQPPTMKAGSRLIFMARPPSVPGEGEEE